jgi:hypothetical protein
MKHQSDSSFFKSLAVAFGDGLAFGVGMKIAQASGHKQAAEPQAEAPGAAPAPAALPAAAEPLDLQVLSKVLASIDARLSQHTGTVERRLAESEARVLMDVKALENRQAMQSSETQAALETQAKSVEQGLEARLQAYVDGRMTALGERLHKDITQAGDRTAKLLVDTIEMRLLGRIAVLEREARSLRAQRDGAQQRLHELIQGFSRACQEAIQEMETAAQADKPEDSGSGPAPGDGSSGSEEEPAADPGDRRYDSLRLVNYQVRAEKRLAIPLVSSLIVAVAGLAWLGAGAGWF